MFSLVPQRCPFAFLDRSRYFARMPEKSDKPRMKRKFCAYVRLSTIYLSENLSRRKRDEKFRGYRHELAVWRLKFCAEQLSDTLAKGMLLKKKIVRESLALGTSAFDVRDSKR